MEALRGWEPAQGQTTPGGFHPSSEGSAIRKRREQGLANQSEPAPQRKLYYNTARPLMVWPRSHRNGIFQRLRQKPDCPQAHGIS